jgi:ubiquinone/menaquinone biosynthesis C-methylase UbiE
MMKIFGAAYQYQLLIDPLLRKAHLKGVDFIDPDCSVIDIACGNGTLAMMCTEKSKYVTGIDVSREMITEAKARADKSGIENIDFIRMDAAELSQFKSGAFDTAIISMAVHQFKLELSISILEELKRISKSIVIIDYKVPLARGFSGMATRLIERIAGKEHNRNFKAFVEYGGLVKMLEELELSSIDSFDHSVFTIHKCK